jgi:hypothetical protein
MDVLLGGPTVMDLEPVAWVLAVVAGAALLLSARLHGWALGLDGCIRL